MKTLQVLLLAMVTVCSCKSQVSLTNQTRPGGYAMGEKIALQFSLSPSQDAPDSISVFVLEKKTGYLYSTWAMRSGCNERCDYSVVWDGRKPDGRWPVGGRYLVYAIGGSGKKGFSDTVEVGLAD